MGELPDVDQGPGQGFSAGERHAGGDRESPGCPDLNGVAHPIELFALVAGERNVKFDSSAGVASR